MKPQLLIIHGGSTFDTYEDYMKYLQSCELTLDRLSWHDWKDNLVKELPEFEVVYPKMPNPKNARYPEWKIWFEKIMLLLRDDVTLVGHSLGGIFLAKYLSENTASRAIRSLHLVAAPYDTEVIKDSLADFALSKTVEDIEKQVPKIFIYQSKDDLGVAFADAEKYKRDLPSAAFVAFEDRGHFLQEDFPELVQNIKDTSAILKPYN